MSLLFAAFVMLAIFGVGALVCRFCPTVLDGLFPGGERDE